MIEGAPRLNVKSMDKMSELEKVCKVARGREPSATILGDTLFPDAPMVKQVDYSFFSKADLDAMQDRLLMIDLFGCVDYNSPLVLASIIKVGSIIRFSFPFQVAACASPAPMTEPKLTKRLR